MMNQETATATSATGTYLKLVMMMILEFFIWGAWLPLIFGYLPSLGFSATVWGSAQARQEG
jgi:hypothetical protein